MCEQKVGLAASDRRFMSQPRCILTFCRSFELRSPTHEDGQRETFRLRRTVSLPILVLRNYFYEPCNYAIYVLWWTNHRYYTNQSHSCPWIDLSLELYYENGLSQFFDSLKSQTMSSVTLNFLENLELKNNRSYMKYLVFLKKISKDFWKFLFFIVFYSNKYFIVIFFKKWINEILLVIIERKLWRWY